MTNVRTIPLEMDEYKELMMLKGTMVSLENYVKNASFIDKEVLLAILGFAKKEESDARTN